MSIEDFMKIPGFQNKMATKMHDSIKERLHKESLLNVMAASNVFGRGFSEKKIKDIMEAEPDIIISTHSLDDKINKIKKVNGISMKSAIQFVENIDKFITFMKKTNMAAKLLITIKKSETETETLIGKSFALTGFRDEKLQDYITKNGGKIVTTITKNTTSLIVKETNYKENTKTAQAIKREIPILTKEEFYELYNNE